MKKLIHALVFGTSMLVAGAAVAGVPAKAAQPAKAAPPTSQPAQLEHVQGTITAINTKEHSLTVKTDAGDRVVLLDKSSKIERDGKALPLAKLTTGQKIDIELTKVKGRDKLKNGKLSS